MSASEAISYLAALAVTILGYFLKDKHGELKGVRADHDKLGQRVAQLELTQAVQGESNKGRDNRMESIEKKLDRLLEKLQA
jgi:hypothetical protein